MAERNSSISTHSHQQQQQQRARNNPDRETPSTLGISTVKPKYPQYATPSRRLASFTEASHGWPESAPVTVPDLVAAGFVYTGVGDSVRCYHCGGGMRNWESGDDVMEEHARYYPTCEHVLIAKGRKYIQRVEAGEHPDREPAPSVAPTPSRPSEADRLRAREATSLQALAENGYSEAAINTALDIFRHSNGADAHFTAVDLGMILLDMEENPDLANHIATSSNAASYHPPPCVQEQLSTYENVDSEDLTELTEENQRLKEAFNCKICLDKLADVIFLPCGHVVSCPQCAHALVECPVCRKPVMGLVKAFFSDMAEVRGAPEME